MTYKDAMRRYENDPMFHTMVDHMVEVARQLQMSPGELREAAVFAEIRFATLYASPSQFFKSNESQLGK